MKAKELAELLLKYPDYDIQTTIHKELSEEELSKRSFPFPYDNYKTELELDDIGHSSNVICFGCDLTLREMGEIKQ